MTEFFDKFIISFCKVQFLCFDWWPNWLGWGVLGIGAIILIFIFFAFAGS